MKRLRTFLGLGKLMIGHRKVLTASQSGFHTYLSETVLFVRFARTCAGLSFSVMGLLSWEVQ